MNDLANVVIYTDGACLGNPGPGGFAAVLLLGEHRRELSGGYAHTTNNRMELLAAIHALEALKRSCHVTLYSDARYLVDGMARGVSGAAANRDLWRRLLALCRQHEVEFIWVRGHTGNVENERCDVLATSAARGEDLPVDEGYQRQQTAQPTLFDTMAGAGSSG